MRSNSSEMGRSSFPNGLTRRSAGEGNGGLSECVREVGRGKGE